MKNIWESLPLNDYEKHMAHTTVGQLQLLNQLTKKYLSRFAPKSVMFLGVSGGNGLEHIDNNVTSKIIGIDINQDYLEETRARFESRLVNLELIKKDISVDTDEIERADLIWGALILEYVDLSQCFRFVSNNLQDNGHVALTIQSNNGVSSISQTGVETIKMLGPIFKAVDPTELLSLAGNVGFVVIDREENWLPNGKSLKTFVFKKS